ncbi:hypothetical protein UlMin_026638 [Ulmus minor]
MDWPGSSSFIVSKRKESISLRAEIVQALGEVVDLPRLVLDSLEEFVRLKSRKVGVTDKKRPCGLLVQALFPVANSRKKGCGFARRIVERAAKILEQWKGEMDGELEGTLGAAEAFDKEFLRKMMIKHASWRDMAKMAAALEDKEKMREAIYFASESGLTERFPPVSLLKSHLRNSKNNTTNRLKNGNNSSAATPINLKINVAMVAIGSRGCGKPSFFCSTKVAKDSNAYPSSWRNSNPVTYGLAHTRSSVAVPQEHYSLPGDNFGGGCGGAFGKICNRLSINLI